MMKQKIINLVAFRLSALPPDVIISVGDYGAFSRRDLIKHVKENDAVGQKITEIELNYLRSLKKGIFYA